MECLHYGGLDVTKLNTIKQSSNIATDYIMPNIPSNAITTVSIYIIVYIRPGPLARFSIESQGFRKDKDQEKTMKGGIPRNLSLIHI